MHGERGPGRRTLSDTADADGLLRTATPTTVQLGAAGVGYARPAVSPVVPAMALAEEDGGAASWEPFPGTSTAYHPTAIDRTCWLSFRVAVAVVVLLLVALWLGGLQFPPRGPVPAYTAEYFALCFVGGAISGLPHVLFTPLDLMKCRIQVGEYATLREGLALLRREAAVYPSCSRRAGVAFRGWAPTLVGYLLQGSAKYGFYELFKYNIALRVSYQFAHAHMAVIFIAAAGIAEGVADVLLAPWEATKIRMQTSRQYPPLLHVLLPRIWATEGVRGFYKSLPALWTRQVPYTIVKFYSFELIVRLLLQSYAAWTGQSSLPSRGSVVLALTLLGGGLAGCLCALVSHPADTIVARLNQRSDSRHGLLSLLQSLSCRDIWKGLELRLVLVGLLTALQWFCYDGFRFAVGLATTGRAVQQR